MLANTSWKILLRQENAVIQELIEKFGLNKEETNYLLTAQAGQGLLFAMNDRIPLKVVFSEKEYDIITTNPDELRKREIQKKGISQESELNEEIYQLKKIHYKASELKPQHKKFLKKAGYTETRQASLTNAGACNYFILQKNENESIEHQFLVQLIYEELRKYTDVVQRYAVQKPDLIFVANGKKIAFEIETGNVIRNATEFQEKTKLLNKEYSYWYFIVTHQKLKGAYAKHGKVLLRTQVKKKLKQLFKK